MYNKSVYCPCTRSGTDVHKCICCSFFFLFDHGYIHVILYTYVYDLAKFKITRNAMKYIPKLMIINTAQYFDMLQFNLSSNNYQATADYSNEQNN